MKDKKLKLEWLGKVIGGMHNPYYKEPYHETKEYTMTDGRIVRGYVANGFFIQIKL